MIAKYIRRRLREARLTRLAKATLAETLRLYESGEFGWIPGEELQSADREGLVNPRGFLTPAEEHDFYAGSGMGYDDLGIQRVDGFGEYAVFSREPRVGRGGQLAKAAFGCALGGLSKAAWLVTGQPEPGTDAWHDKVLAEVEAQMILSQAILERSERPEGRIEANLANPSLGVITSRNDQHGKATILDDLRHALGQSV